MSESLTVAVNISDMLRVPWPKAVMWHAQFCLVRLVSELQWRNANVRYCCFHVRRHEDVWRIGDTTPCVLNRATRWR